MASRSGKFVECRPTETGFVGLYSCKYWCRNRFLLPMREEKLLQGTSGGGSVESSPADRGSANLLSCKCCCRNECFRSRRRPDACNLQGNRAAAPASRPCRLGRMRLTVHLCTHPLNSSYCCGLADQQEVVKSGQGGSTGARAVQGGSTAGSRPVYGRSRFVTGALAAVKRPQAARGGLERPLWDRKRAAAT